jgi:hypothetical protein
LLWKLRGKVAKKLLCLLSVKPVIFNLLLEVILSLKKEILKNAIWFLAGEEGQRVHGKRSRPGQQDVQSAHLEHFPL